MNRRALSSVRDSMSIERGSWPLQSWLLFAVLLCCACSGADEARATTRDSSSSGVAVDGVATRALWNEFGRLATEDLGASSLRLIDEGLSMPETHVGALLGALAEVESARCERVAALPMVGVDARATDLLVQWVRARQAAAKAVSADANAAEQSAALDGEHLFLGFVLELISAADSGEGAFQKALLSQASATGDELQALRQSAAAVQRQMQEAAALAADLVPAEAAARAALTQRFGQEFPPLASYKSPAPDVPLPKAETIPALLLGFELAEPDWTFESLDEFTSFEVVSQSRKAPDHIEARVRTSVRGSWSGEEHDLELTVHLLHFCGEWYVFDLSGWE